MYFLVCQNSSPDIMGNAHVIKSHLLVAHFLSGHVFPGAWLARASFLDRGDRGCGAEQIQLHVFLNRSAVFLRLTQHC